ncbi:IS200/IS605 family transposase [Micromonospora sp. CB01531]|uniref:IS200/IS605 family transposase n=1 Tax=Micromonospora sp. CB01531 TaxID=1718947 RepID=UPI003FD19E0D
MSAGRAGAAVLSRPTFHAHLVFTTKYRRGALTDPILTRCQQVMAEVCQDFSAEQREFNGADDHVHLVVHYPPSVTLSRLVNSLKGVSSRYLRREFTGHLRKYLWDEHLWSPSYFAGSCGAASLTVIKECIENQKRPRP